MIKNLCILAVLPLLLFGAINANAQGGAELGIASYYSDSFHGNETAHGEIYDKNKLTAAHKIHPNGTKLRVTRLDNNKSVVVTVNDRGPYISGRAVDLSKAAAERLGIVDDGVAEVKIEVVGQSSVTETSASAEKSTKPVRKTVPDSYEEPRPKRITDTGSSSTKISSNSTSKAKPATKSKASTSSATTARRPTSTAAKARLVGKEFEQYGIYKINIAYPEKGNYGVQVASLTNHENVFRQVADLQEKSFDDILVNIEKGKDKPVYKIILGPFDSEASAENYRKNLASRYKIKGFVVTLNEE